VVVERQDCRLPARSAAAAEGVWRDEIGSLFKPAVSFSGSITACQHRKPANPLPEFGQFTAGELRALAACRASLA
jgi:hypothetical protein